MARPRLTHRPRDMILSLGVMLVPILLISWLFTTRTETPVRPVDWQPVAQQARAEAGYQVLAPTGLPDTWVPTRATWDKSAGMWVSGWLTPDEIYVQVAQRDVPAPALIGAVTRELRPDGERRVGDATWQAYRSDDDRTRGLVLPGTGVTTLVSGDTSYEALAAFAATLR